MRGGGRSRASKRRRKERMEKRRAAANPSPVSNPSPARQTVSVRRVVVDPGPFVPGRRVSDLPSVSSLRRQAGLPDKPARDALSAPDAAVSPRKRQVSINGNVAAYRAGQLDRKPGAASAKLWRDDAAKSASRDDRPDDKRPAECHPRPERVAKPPTAGGGSAPPRWTNWCK